MRCCRALLAGLLAGGAGLAAPAAQAQPPPAGAALAPDAVRDVFGLGPPAAAPGADQPRCDDGLAFACAIATDPLADATPYALSTWLPGSYLRRLPTADLTHDAVASYGLGAGRDGAGPVFGGASGLENRWTIDGAPADNIRTGGADTRVPLAFLDGILVTAGGLSARDRTSTGGTIDARLVRGTATHQVTTDVWSSLTADAATRPIASGAYTLRRVTANPGPDVTASLVATGPLGSVLGGRAWYAAGIAPNLARTDVAWRAARVMDADHDDIPDGLPGDVITTPIENTRARTLDYSVPAMARVGYDGGAHHLELSLVGQAQRDTRFLGNATMQAAGVDRRDLIGDAIATWRGTWSDTHARLQLAWHRSAHTESAHDAAAANIPQVNSAYLPASLPDDPALVAACAGDPMAAVASCPVPFGFFASGGAGLLTNLVGDRPSATADLAHRFGRNVVRVGVTAEDSRLVTTSAYTGHEEQFSLFTDELSHRHFYVGQCSDDLSQPCDVATGSQLTYRTIYAAAYAEDTFSPADGLAVDGGLRWELMWVGSRLHFSQELAPRVGVAWDVLGGGRSRIWANLGKSFAMLPAGLGPTLIRRDATVDDFSLAGTQSRSHDTGSPASITSGIEPVEQDEVSLGAEFALAGALRATLWGQGRFIRRALETTADGFANPGAGTTDQPAIRETELVAFQLEMAATDKLAIRAGVTWGRTVGTWAGPYDPRQGFNALQGSDWDSGSINLSGTLPTDTGARVFMEIERRGRLGAVGLAVATRLTLGSGTPRSVLADGSDGTVDLLPRGDAGRNPVIGQANLRLAASWRGFTATLDVFNVLDRREPTSVDEIYSDDAVRPIDGGSYSDLVFLKTDSGQAAHRRTSFQLPTTYQAPISASLGIHKAF